MLQWCRAREMESQSTVNGHDPFIYSRVVVSGVPSSLPEAALRMGDPSEKVDLEKARLQHERYVHILRELVKDVHVIPPDEKYPDCVFVEDPVVVCDDTAFLPILGHESRRGETVAMKKMMKQLDMKIVEMVDPGTLDGGDVLFTGKEFFVGQSKRTNESGLSQLAAAFPAYPVTGIPVKEGLHLKSCLSMAGPDLIAISTSPNGTKFRKLVEEKGKFKYRFFEVPDDFGANCLYINNTIVHISKAQSPESFERYEQLATKGEKVTVDASELNKVDGCLTCSSVLIK